MGWMKDILNDGQPQTYTAVLIFLKEAGLINKL